MYHTSRFSPFCRSYQRISPGPRHMYPFQDKGSFCSEELLAPVSTQSWSTTPLRPSVTAYSIYSHLPSILKTLPLSATWGRAMPWWQGTTYHGFSIPQFSIWCLHDCIFLTLLKDKPSGYIATSNEQASSRRRFLFLGRISISCMSTNLQTFPIALGTSTNSGIRSNN